MQALLVVDFFQKLFDQSPGFLKIAVFGAVAFLVFESLQSGADSPTSRGEQSCSE